MDYQALRAELTGDPLGRGYGALDDRAAAERLNLADRSVAYPRLISERAVLSDYDLGPLAADAVLTKLEQAAASGAPLAGVLRRALRFLQTPEGLDIGHPMAQQLVGQLAEAGVLTAQEAGALQALGLRSASRAEELELGPVATYDVTVARAV